MNTTKPAKPKVCKVCKTKFTPARSMAVVCSPLCALEHSRAQSAKKAATAAAKDRKETRVKLEKLKSPKQWADEAQVVVNKYVRLRDRDLGCVSCDKPPSWQGQWHASHFRSRGAASAIRFHLWNIHKSCSICNNWKSGNLSEYEPRLVDRIGAEKVQWLREQNAVTSFSVEYSQRLKKVFAKKIKRLEGRLHD
jgi:hypothetical protein